MKNENKKKKKIIQPKFIISSYCKKKWIICKQWQFDHLPPFAKLVTSLKGFFGFLF